MRQLKFRAWLKKEKEMRAVSIIYNLDVGRNHHVNVVKKNGFGLREMKHTEIELMQFTGLKDKNGNEIWEGDLLNNSSGDLVGVVEFGIYDNGLSYEDNDRGNGWNIGGHTTLDEFYAGLYYSVVGNIYENPELILPIDNNNPQD